MALDPPVTMGACHGLREVFAVGSVLMILLIVYWDQEGGGFNPFTLYPLQDPKRDSVPDPFGSSHPLPQATRKRRIFDVCTAMGEESVNFPGKSRTFGQIPHRELDHLIVDDTHRIIYCNVPKIASTNWKRIMVVLAGSTNYTDPGSIPHLEAHNLLQTFAGLGNGNQSRNLMELKLQHYTKFLFVRDPFIRLISVFRSKFERPNHYFYQKYGSVILRRYANLSGSLPAGVAEAFAAGIIPTFQQFITYLLDPQTEKEEPFDEHWRQIWKLIERFHIEEATVEEILNKYINIRLEDRKQNQVGNKDGNRQEEVGKWMKWREEGGTHDKCNVSFNVVFRIVYK